MAILMRRLPIAGLVLTCALAAGCNPFLALYYAAVGMDSKLPAEFALVPKDKGVDVRVVILVSSALETRPEFLRVDRELGSIMAHLLQKGCKDNRENVTIVPMGQVEKFKDQHPNWKTLDAATIGRYFHADYVIDLEINSLSLYEPGSHNTLYQGRGHISVVVTDMHSLDDGPAYQNEKDFEYPRGRPIPADNNNPQQFRLLFLNRIATDLAWLFTAHTVESDYHMD